MNPLLHGPMARHIQDLQVHDSQITFTGSTSSRPVAHKAWFSLATKAQAQAETQAIEMTQVKLTNGRQFFMRLSSY